MVYIRFEILAILAQRLILFVVLSHRRQPKRKNINNQATDTELICALI